MSGGALEELQTLEGHTDRVWQVTWSPNGDMLASCSGDRTVRIWARDAADAARWRCAAVLEDCHSRTIRSAAWSPDGRCLATASFDRTTAVWRHAGGVWEQVAVLEGHESEVKEVAWSPGGGLLATCSRDKTVWLWEAAPGNEYEVVDVKHGHSQDVKTVHWHPSGEVLVSASYDDSIKLWVEEDDEWICAQTLAEPTGHTSTVWEVAFDPAGARMASCSDDATLKVWACRKEDGELRWRLLSTLSGFHDRTVFSVDWSKGGLIASGCADNAIRIFGEGGGSSGEPAGAGAGEVGLAVLDAGGGRLLLAQHIDTTRSFAHTMSLLELYNPARLLVVAEARGTGVSRATAHQFAQVPVPRGNWDDSQGYVSLCQYATVEARAALEGGMLQAANSGYLAHAAAGALLRYLELGDSGVGLVLARGSLAVQHVGSASHMAIDAGTAAALELIHPLRVGTCSAKLSGLSLFKVLDRTKTRCGARLLRASLLQPLRDVPTLNGRYDAVQELAQDFDVAGAVGACLARLPPDMDRMCGALSLRPAKSEATMLRRIAAMIQSFILLRESLATLPPLAEALAGARCEVLRAVRDAAGHAAFAELARELEAVLEDDVASSKNAFLNRTQQCFAVKKGCDGFLDVARQTFCRVTEQVHELAEQLRAQHSLPDLRVCYTGKRGFYLHVGGNGGGGRRGKHPREMMEEEQEGGSREEDGHTEAAPQASTQQGGGGGWGRGGGGGARLPPEFSVLQQTARGMQASTAELGALNSRLRDSSNDCLVLTEQVLEGLATRIVATYLPLLHRLVDSLALLDMLAGFAAVASGAGVKGGRGGGASSDRQYVRPVLTQGGPLALVEARHPLLECLDEGAPFQPNDTFLALNSSLHIITGPNMSGKSTYLRQVALCVVAAQAGAFVPAAFASLPPVDRLLARLGTGDSLETNSSSFAVEMQEVAHILAAASPRSLVLIDELGRSTSTSDGAGIAWAVAEALLERSSPTLFATHFGQLSELAAVYPAAKALSFDLGDVAGRRALDFTWRLRPGANDAGHYGLLLAAAVGFPADVLATAEEVVQVLDASEGQRATVYATAEAEELEAVYDVVQKLFCVAQSFGSPAAAGQQEARALQRTLRRLKAEAATALGGGEAAAAAPLG
ncbi:DNA mismatch repair MSH4 [Micractinium conductrix]|uniref:Probable cytosolic iron-sulfur protein assembly protein CIAO1 homolog n=1 Tax=Micractinium conductrix TaxID=554055 RepID=A0A2P6V477_9CHLO|nr:DNA mismatch repair MSH4 [Micractinium conductrix]|eukprot:PSC68890.1 DNA mismatch repair MSH4 [Micractinium conductrix]